MIHGNPAKSTELLESARPFDLGGGYRTVLIRGNAYLRGRDGSSAVKEFRTILDHAGVNPVAPAHALARIGLARAYALSGDATKAKAAYQDFFAQWKNADPDIPILQQARAEYAKLK